MTEETLPIEASAPEPTGAIEVVNAEELAPSCKVSEAETAAVARSETIAAKTAIDAENAAKKEELISTEIAAAAQMVIESARSRVPRVAHTDCRQATLPKFKRTPLSSRPRTRLIYYLAT